MTNENRRRSNEIRRVFGVGVAAVCACSATDLSSLTEGDDAPPSSEADADVPVDLDTGTADDGDTTGLPDASFHDAAEGDAEVDAATDADSGAGDADIGDAADAGPSCVWSDFRAPSKTESVKNSKADSDSTSWSNTAGASTVDGSFAHATAEHGPSHFLRVTNFGFDVPTSAEIGGVEVEIWRRVETEGGMSSDVVDDSVKLQLGAASTSQGDRAQSSKWPTTVAATTYGGGDDTWGEILTGAAVDDAAFGAVLSFRNNSFLDARGAVDAVRVRVRFCVP